MSLKRMMDGNIMKRMNDLYFVLTVLLVSSYVD